MEITKEKQQLLISNIIRGMMPFRKLQMSLFIRSLLEMYPDFASFYCKNFLKRFLWNPLEKKQKSI